MFQSRQSFRVRTGFQQKRFANDLNLLIAKDSEHSQPHSLRRPPSTTRLACMFRVSPMVIFNGYIQWLRSMECIHKKHRS